MLLSAREQNTFVLTSIEKILVRLRLHVAIFLQVYVADSTANNNFLYRVHVAIFFLISADPIFSNFADVIFYTYLIYFQD